MGGKTISNDFCAFKNGSCHWGDYVSFIIRTAIAGLVLAVVFALIGVLTWVLWYGCCCRHNGVLRRTRLSRYGYLEGKTYTRRSARGLAYLGLFNLAVCALLAIGLIASSAVFYTALDDLTDAFYASIVAVRTALVRLLFSLNATNSVIPDLGIPIGFARFVQQATIFLEELATSIHDNAHDIDSVNIATIVIATCFAVAVLVLSVIGVWNILRKNPSPTCFTALSVLFLVGSVFIWLLFVLWLVLAINIYDSCQNMVQIIRTSTVSRVFNSVYDCPRLVVDYAAGYVQATVPAVRQSACIDAGAFCSNIASAICPPTLCVSDPLTFINEIGVSVGNAVLNVTECTLLCTGSERLGALELSRDFVALNLLPAEVRDSSLLRSCSFILDLVRKVNHSLCHTAPHSLFATITIAATLSTFMLPLAGLLATANRRLNPACWGFIGPLWASAEVM